jgi:hypothetical protein
MVLDLDQIDRGVGDERVVAARVSVPEVGRHPMPQTPQLTLNPRIPPRRVLLSQRTINSTRSWPIGGRPGALGCRHLRATRRWCQRNTVPGVTSRCARTSLGNSLTSAANTVRAGHSSRGFGFLRRRTPTSWRSTNSSMSLAAPLRASSTNQAATRQNAR